MPRRLANSTLAIPPAFVYGGSEMRVRVSSRLFWPSVIGGDMGQIGSTSDGVPSPRRSASRLRLRLAANVDSINGTQRAVIRDLSQTGAKLLLSEPISEGRDVVINWAGYEAFGRTVWVLDSWCGIKFDSPLDPKCMIATRDLQDLRGLTEDQEREWVAQRGWGFAKPRS